MSTKNAQSPGRRTPLSLNAGTKQVNKSNNDKINSGQKETTAHNQKTENLKKDTQLERKPSTDKRQSMTDAKKSSSSDSKRTDETKTAAKVEDKKNQNGVNANGVNKTKEKSDSNEEVVSKNQANASSTNGTPRKESQKSIEKKKDSPAEVPAGEAKTVEARNKAEEKASEKEKVNADSNKKVADEKKKDKEKKEITEKKKVEEKPSEEKLDKVAAAAKPEEKINKEPEMASKSDNNKPDKVAVVLPPPKERTIDEAKTPVASVDGEQIAIEKPSETIEKSSDAAAQELADVEMMPPLAFEDEIPLQISASSTPAKPLTSTKSSKIVDSPSKASARFERPLPEAPSTYTPDRNAYPKTFSSISGRRSIRPVGDYTFNGKMRESYRRINTELDFTSSSLNVTVGSEIPNNDSFSFLSSSRKRDRTLQSQHSVMDISPPKRARVEISDFFTVMASPITKLRARLSRATVQSTPKKQVEEIPIDQDVVETVSAANEDEATPIENLAVDQDITVGNIDDEEDFQKLDDNHPIQKHESPAIEGFGNDDDIQIRETIDTQAKKKCSIM